MKKSAIRKLFNPYKVWLALDRRGFFNWLPDKLFLRIKYRCRTGKRLHLRNPKRFNEKLQWIKLFDRNPQYTMMVDKLGVREFIKEKIGEEYLVPLLGHWDTADEIDFDALPKQFVLKCNHDSQSVVICKDKTAFYQEGAKQKLSRKLKKGTFNYGREWPYKDVKPCIIAEKYLEDNKYAELRDYKFFCFNGECKCFKIDYNRFTYHQANYYDPDGHLMKFGEKAYPPDYEKNIEIPESVFTMKKLAEKCADKIPFLRVDFYDVDGRIYFGELTFFPASGFGKFVPDEYDDILGSWLSLTW